jgi:uncharacterized protein (UPF0335 family)
MRATRSASRSRRIITLDEAETQRWKDASQATVDKWYADATAAGFDGKALHEAAHALVGA